MGTKGAVAFAKLILNSPSFSSETNSASSAASGLLSLKKKIITKVLDDCGNQHCCDDVNRVIGDEFHYRSVAEFGDVDIVSTAWVQK